MWMRTIPILLALGIATFAVFYPNSPSIPSLEIHLPSGTVNGIVHLGQLDSEILEASKAYEPREWKLIPADLNYKQFTQVIEISTLGISVYLRNRRAALIVIGRPFKGQIANHSLPLFEFGKSKQGSWSRTLSQKFGEPQAKASGGSFNSEAHFYTWGDVTFNRNGLSEVALYRGNAISVHRQESFGKEIKSLISKR